MVEAIGEAARNVERHAPNVVAAHPDIPWRYAKGMRNHLMHGYFSVDLESVWATTQADLPDLRAQLTVLRSELAARSGT